LSVRLALGQLALEQVGRKRRGSRDRLAQFAFDFAVPLFIKTWKRLAPQREAHPCHKRPHLEREAKAGPYGVQRGKAFQGKSGVKRELGKPLKNLAPESV